MKLAETRLGMRKWEWSRYTPRQLVHALRVDDDGPGPDAFQEELRDAVARFRELQRD